MQAIYIQMFSWYEHLCSADAAIWIYIPHFNICLIHKIFTAHCIPNYTSHVIDISGHMSGIFVYMPIFSDNLSWIHNIYIYMYIYISLTLPFLSPCEFRGYPCNTIYIYESQKLSYCQPFKVHCRISAVALQFAKMVRVS